VLAILGNYRLKFIHDTVIILFITREYDYALRTLRALSVSERLTVKEICSIEHIPQPYAYKILKKLEKASIVKGHRGTHGGYKLISPLQHQTLYDIYIAVEENMCISECMRDGYACPNDKEGGRCAIHKELLRVQEALIQGLRQRSLAEILNAVNAE